MVLDRLWCWGRFQICAGRHRLDVSGTLRWARSPYAAAPCGRHRRPFRRGGQVYHYRHAPAGLTSTRRIFGRPARILSGSDFKPEQPPLSMHDRHHHIRLPSVGWNKRFGKVAIAGQPTGQAVRLRRSGSCVIRRIARAHPGCDRR